MSEFPQVRSKLAGIQALRGIAALLVVLRHSESTIDLFLGLQPGTWLSFGQMGVDVFFVMSGFIMVYVTPAPLVSLRDLGTFLFRRIARIYPAYWAITIPALLWRGWKGSLTAHGTYDLAAWIFLLPYRNVPPLIVAWTLVYEVHFYVICAAILFLPGRYRVYAALIWLAVVSAATLFQFNLWNLYTSWWLAPYPFEFIAGMILAHGAINGPRLYIHKTVAALLVGAAFLFMMIYVHKEGFFDFGAPALLRMLVLGVPSLLIVALVYQMDVQGEWPWMKKLGPLGDRSYSIYLLHFLVLTLVFDYGAKFLPGHSLVSALGALIFAYGILAVLVELSYRLIERPCQQLARRLAPHTESGQRTSAQV